MHTNTLFTGNKPSPEFYEALKDIRSNHLTSLQEKLDKKPGLILEKDENNKVLMEFALMEGNLETMRVIEACYAKLPNGSESIKPLAARYISLFRDWNEKVLFFTASNSPTCFASNKDEFNSFMFSEYSWLSEIICKIEMADHHSKDSIEQTLNQFTKKLDSTFKDRKEMYFLYNEPIYLLHALIEKWDSLKSAGNCDKHNIIWKSMYGYYLRHASLNNQICLFNKTFQELNVSVSENAGLGYECALNHCGEEISFLRENDCRTLRIERKELTKRVSEKLEKLIEFCENIQKKEKLTM